MKALEKINRKGLDKRMAASRWVGLDKSKHDQIQTHRTHPRSSPSPVTHIFIWPYPLDNGEVDGQVD